jgi:hypothetical protein
MRDLFGRTPLRAKTTPNLRNKPMTMANEQNGSQTRSDERLKKVSMMTALLRRPELGAVAGLVLVTIFFFFTANPAMFTLAGVVNFMARHSCHRRRFIDDRR